jgi:ribosomal protein L37AE/L43A
MTRIPPLTCPQCQSTHVTKTRYGTINCDECGKATTPSGAVRKADEEYEPRRKHNSHHRPRGTSLTPVATSKTPLDRIFKH